MSRLHPLVMMVAGTTIGAAFVAIVQWPPSKGDARRAARELVPAGLTVTRSESGGYVIQAFPWEGPFFVSIEATGPQGMVELEAAVRAAAE